MELLCCETQADFPVISRSDRSLLDDDRVIANLLDSEMHFAIGKSYFDTFQNEIKPEMRRILITWMSEVSLPYLSFVICLQNGGIFLVWLFYRQIFEFRI